jgi:hypothetical protein
VQAHRVACVLLCVLRCVVRRDALGVEVHRRSTGRARCTAPAASPQLQETPQAAAADAHAQQA